MKPARHFLLLFFVLPYFAFAQYDTIYSTTGKIVANVKEIGENSIKFSYQNEDLLNNLNKNVIKKIVFKSGRVQTFSNLSGYKTVKSGLDYENVSISQVFEEVKGLYKIGEAGAKAKGTTVLSSIEKVKERAIRKMKITAAMQGANVVYQTQINTTDNIPGETDPNGKSTKAGQPTQTTISGIAYSSEQPSIEEFKQVIGNRKLFSVINLYEFENVFNILDPFNSNTDIKVKTINKTMELNSINEESGFIYVQSKIEKENNTKFRVIFFNNEEFTIEYKTDKGIYNYRVRILN
ncbi:MAG: hypothetical protein K2Q21_11430 [Chitinophagaceae bacterium]|nr:hypothetical protein [Chitinophagaceae bacterium]